MSLRNIARHLESKGRNGDQMLVHMTPGEVQGLQALAMKHGGSLTINPETGLPEANILKAVLPIAAGIALGPAGLGMSSAMAGLTVGGVTAVATRNLGQGIMAGLGAYGGAGISQGLMTAGAPAASAAMSQGAAATAAETAGTLGNQFAYNAAGEMVPANLAPSITGAAEGTQLIGQPTTSASIQQGFKQAAANPGAFFKQNMFPIGATGIALLGASEPTQATIPAPQQATIQPYTYTQTRNPDFGNVPGASYFNQTFTPGTPYTAKEGGIVDLAGGGIVALADGGVPPVQQLQVAPNLGQYSQRQAPAVSPSVTAYNQILADRAANEYVVQPAPLPVLPGGGERANAADTQKLINQYYLSELGRQGEQAGLDYWTKQKMDAGMSLADIKKAISQSEEARARREAAAGPKPVYFDPEFYAKQNPDIARVSEYKADPFLHYQRHGFKEGRAGAAGYTGSEMLGLAPKPAEAPRTLGGYTYDQATGTFTKAPEPKPVDPFNTMLEDPAFRSWAQQNLYNQYLQSQQPQYGKSGGLMPNDLKYAAGGGISDLGGYSDGGRLLKGPGDGVSDSIPAQIGERQPARLADGEFVVPARIVSELGNGSTDAGARKLYAMMDRIQKKRRKSVGKNKVAVDTKPESALPA